MFYHFLYPLNEFFGGFNVVKYITFRTFAALLTAMLFYLVCGKPWIRFLKNRQMAQTIRMDGPQAHLGKKGTPTMGGLLLIVSVLFSVFLWGNWGSDYLGVSLYVFVGMGAIGFVDDYKKVMKRDTKGFAGRYKIILEVFICLSAALFIYGYKGLDTRLYVPFLKQVQPDLSFWYLFLTIFVVVGAANAVNLTDGLDGLAAVPSMTAFLTYGFLVYVVGHVVISNYLQIPFVKESGELAVLCGAVVGACIGFLWFNAYPAEIFMGDVGALGLGGLLGFVALIAKQEILLVLVGGLFVMETLSVITQVISFKLTGKRIFRMAPLHHHFELKGWSEPKIIVRFWILSFVLALLSLATLKLR
ncbi:MAG TPA: phospho-N-acetylmuramoyl-pentapeptide-transferase [Deltaproteobacteria bacterium]|nr:MAG: phospho-N-acetylmuramoyl-pentapeptide-transferase [Deltaproteobacteria bacterium GWA2_45_12]HBF11930.1 phospho-N-acetylmuramoyl-pentapeptide-transferase [Deltaproteobacteria bacterium]